MFDLDERIASWRASASAELGPGVIEELEGHLRDDFERLVAGGRPEEEAWGHALVRLGDARQIAAEFAKVRARRWVPGRIASVGLAAIVAAVTWWVGGRVATGRVGALLATHVVAVTTGYVALLAVGFLAAWAVMSRALGAWDDGRAMAFRVAGRRLALVAIMATGLGVVLGAVWARGHLGRSWGWDAKEVGGLCVLAWGALAWRAFRLRGVAETALFHVALMGNVVVCAAWFGPGLAAGGHGAGSGFGMGVGAFVIAHAAMMHVAILPVAWLRRGSAGTSSRG